jgi:hypothetical protein
LEETSLPSFPSVRFIQPGEGILPNMVRWKDHVRMKVWAWDEKNLPSIAHAIRTAVAATVSVIIAGLGGDYPVAEILNSAARSRVVRLLREG